MPHANLDCAACSHLAAFQQFKFIQIADLDFFPGITFQYPIGFKFRNYSVYGIFADAEQLGEIRLAEWRFKNSFLLVQEIKSVYVMGDFLERRIKFQYTCKQLDRDAFYGNGKDKVV